MSAPVGGYASGRYPSCGIDTRPRTGRRLSFRNLHNWMKEGDAPEVLAAFYRALKPGGVLGVVDHRGQRDAPQDPVAADGYVRQDYAVALVEKAGFEFVGSSEIDANPSPPTLALGDEDRAKYAAIGEADNFVLKFRKPASEAR